METSTQLVLSSLQLTWTGHLQLQDFLCCWSTVSVLFHSVENGVLTLCLCIAQQDSGCSDCGLMVHHTCLVLTVISFMCIVSTATQTQTEQKVVRSAHDGICSSAFGTCCWCSQKSAKQAAHNIGNQGLQAHPPPHPLLIAPPAYSLWMKTPSSTQYQTSNHTHHPHPTPLPPIPHRTAPSTADQNHSSFAHHMGMMSQTVPWTLTQSQA